MHQWFQSIANMNATPQMIIIDCDLVKSRQFVLVFGVMVITSGTVHGMNQLVDKSVEWGTARNKLEHMYLEMQRMRDEMKSFHVRA